MTQDPQAMRTEIYINALLVDEELADQVWEAWDVVEIDDQLACIAWWFIAVTMFYHQCNRFLLEFLTECSSLICHLTPRFESFSLYDP